MVTAQDARLAISDAVVDQLRSLTGTPAVTVYVGEVPDHPPVIQLAGGTSDPAGRVAPYCVSFPHAGDPDRNPSLGPVAPSDLVWNGQITFAAGYVADLLHALDRCVPLLTAWTPTVPGLRCGPLRSDTRLGADVIRRDDDKRPPRFFAATFWRTHVSTDTT